MKTKPPTPPDAAVGAAPDALRTLNGLFNPGSIAVIGATERKGVVGRTVVENLQAGGYQGALYPVNPKRDTILGLKAYPSIGAIGQPVDLAVIITPAATVPAVMAECVYAHVQYAIIISAGFKEAGPAGLELEEQVAVQARRGRVRFIGPNCLGVVNVPAKLNATFAPSMPPVGKISMISQSGALCVAILDWAASIGLGLNKVVSFGNKADLNEVDFLRAFAADPDTSVVAAYLESITEGDRFLEVAEEIASVKPVVVLKVGVTQAGAKAASSHTGSLAGADMAYWAAFKRSGVIRAEHLEALFDYALAFATQPLPAGKRLAIITNAGGPGIMAADAAELCGLQLLPPTAQTRAKLQKALPATAALGNPIDVIGDAEPDRYIKALKLVQKDDNVDGILVVVIPANMTQPLELAKQLHAAHDGKKPLLTAFMGGKEVRAARDYLMQAGIPDYPAPNRAVEAFKAMSDYAAWRMRPPRVVTRFPVNRRRVDRVIQWQMRSGVEQVGEVEAKEILRAYDFNVLDGYLARDPARGRRGRRAHRLPGGAEDQLAGHHPQVRPGRRAHQPVQRRAGARRVRPDDAARAAPRAQRPHPRRLRREDGPQGPRGDPGHDPRPAVRPHADVRPGRHLRRGHEGRHLLPGADHRRRGDADAEGHAFLRAAAGRARPGAGGPRGDRQRAAAHQPAHHRLPADRGAGHQPVHRQRGRHRAVCRRRPHDPLPAGPLT